MEPEEASQDGGVRVLEATRGPASGTGVLSPSDAEGRAPKMRTED